MTKQFFQVADLAVSDACVLVMILLFGILVAIIVHLWHDNSDDY